MKKTPIYLFVVLAAFLIGFVSYSKSPTGIAEEEVLRLMEEFHFAEQAKNKEKLERIFADKIFWSRYKDEKIFSKEEIVTKILKIEFKIYSIETKFISTEVADNQVTVGFWMVVTFINDDGTHFDHHADYRYKFEKIQNEWKLSDINLEN